MNYPDRRRKMKLRRQPIENIYTKFFKRVRQVASGLFVIEHQGLCYFNTDRSKLSGQYERAFYSK